MTEKQFQYNVNKNSIEQNGKYFAFCNGEELKIVRKLNELHKENQLLKEEKELLKNKLDRIEDILPHFLSCAEISEFRGKTVKEDIALMKCWNKRYQK